MIEADDDAGAAGDAIGKVATPDVARSAKEKALDAVTTWSSDVAQSVGPYLTTEGWNVHQKSIENLKAALAAALA